MTVFNYYQNKTVKIEEFKTVNEIKNSLDNISYEYIWVFYKTKSRLLKNKEKYEKYIKMKQKNSSKYGDKKLLSLSNENKKKNLIRFKY